MDRVVVLIFTHRAEPDEYERLSFQQCYKVLGKHSIRLVCPRGMDISRYREMAPGVVPDFIDPKWFRSLRAYNLLKVLPWLYRRYSGYEFMLTYELDAWVFRDELLEWCDQGWDYIGAPWFHGSYDCQEDSPVAGVGNSGFSLRKIGTMQKTLQVISRARFIRLGKDFCKRRTSLAAAIRKALSPALLLRPLRGWVKAEDLFWGHIATQKMPGFRVAPYEVAREFSFEANARRLYAECGQRLPFGAHKWSQLQPDFWKDVIPFPESARS
jgi:hypothetical protein